MKYEVKITSRFKKDYKTIKKRGYPLSRLKVVIEQLQSGKQLDECFRDHALSGNWLGHRECHIQPDWLLIYRIEEDFLVLTLTATGTHADLFNM